MKNIIVGKDDCFLVKAEEIPNLQDTQLYVDMSGVSWLYPFGSSEKVIDIGKGNLVTVTWKNVHRGISFKPTEKDKNIFQIISMYNENKYTYVSPDNSESELLIQCIND